MAYPSQTVGSTYTGFRPHPATRGGLASQETWRANGSQVGPEATIFHQSEGKPEVIRDFRAWSDSSNELTDEVLWLYPDLDNDSRNFLKYGARSAAEKLAFAQQVNSLAHLDAEPAPQDVQQDFQANGDVDQSRHFVGPDGRIYLRNEDSEERLGAKIRRGYENAIGGFPTADISDSLKHISEATRSKRADVELYSPPVLPVQEDRERMLAEHNINPAAWQSGLRAPEEDQEALRDGGYVWDAIYPFAYVGPDGVLYYKTELTRPEPFSQRRRQRDWAETENYLRTLPPPTADELQFAAMANGGHLPGGRQVRFANNSSRRYVRPGSLEARAAIRTRLADIPRQLALRGWARLQAQKSGEHASRRDLISGRKAQVPQNLEETISQVVAENAAIRAKRKRSYFTKAGVPRNKATRLQAWKDFIETWDNGGYEDLISLSNRFRLKLGLSPKVDKHWIAIHPDDAGLLGETIHIHHVNGSPFLQPLPYTRHFDTHYNRNVGYSGGGIGGQAPFYFNPPPKKPKKPKKRK